MKKCVCCDNDIVLSRWTDTHGIGICSCGFPYRFIHYNADGERENKEPEPMVKELWIPLMRRYWCETRRMVSPGTYDMGILRGRTHSYSGATLEDMASWEKWMLENKTEWPEGGD